MTDLGKKLVSEMTADEFFSVFLEVMQDFEARRYAKGDSRLLSMTVEQMTETLMGVLKMKSMRTAVTEADVSRRILADWQGLMDVDAVAQPFRVSTEEALSKLVDDLRGSLKGGGELVVAVAISTGPDLYKAAR